MTTGSFIFSWDILGIESIIPISQYEHIERENTMRILKGEKIIRNPLNSIIQNLMIRAKFNSQRHYEIYAVSCDESLDETYWREQWEEHPQSTADLIRQHGHKLYSDRQTKEPVIR